MAARFEKLWQVSERFAAAGFAEPGTCTAEPPPGGCMAQRAVVPEPVIGRLGSVEGDDEMNPLWLSTVFASYLGVQKGQPARTATPRGRRRRRSFGTCVRSIVVFGQQILRRAVRKFRRSRTIAKTVLWRRPHGGGAALEHTCGQASEEA